MQFDTMMANSFAVLCASFASFAVMNKQSNRKERKVAAKVRESRCVSTKFSEHVR
jgi:hypothetical protein